MSGRAGAKGRARSESRRITLLANLSREVRSRVTSGLIRRLLLSLVLAVLLWGWVTNLEDPIETRRILGIPTTPANRNDSLVVLDEGGLPLVTVVVRGPRSRVGDLEPSDLRATIDLGGVQQVGTQQLPIVVQAPRGVRVVGREPQAVAITLDRQARQTFPLEVDKQPAPPPFSIGNVELATKQVEVRGPASAVGRVTRVVLPVALGDRRDSFEAQFTPEPRDAAGNRVAGVTVTPSTVPASVAVERIGRVVSILPNIRGEPPEGYRVTGTTVSPLSVTIDGPAETIGQLISISTTPIDVFSRTESFALYDVPLVLPPGTRLIDRVTVNVQVQIETQQQRQQFQGLRVEKVNVGNGLRATVTPEEIAITLGGPLDRIRQLRSTDIRVEVDLRGNGPGTYDKQVRISVPADIRVVDPPPIVRVRVDRAATPVPTPTTPPPTPTPAPPPTPVPGAVRDRAVSLRAPR